MTDPTPATPLPLPPPGTLRLLVVEQDPLQALVLEVVLSRAGYAPVLVSNLACARRACCKGVFDLCLLNLNYRRGDVVAAIKELYAEHLLPSMVVSGAVRTTSWLELPGSVVNILPKPYTDPQLLNAVRLSLIRCGRLF